jgi:hypothetical protein
MVGFFSAGLYKLFPQLRVACGQCLRRIERLGAHLAHMVYPHQSAGLGTLGVGQSQSADALRWVRPRGMVLRKNSAQALVNQGNKAVSNGHINT